ncbi:MAG: hypothetical protein HYW47_00895 [Deltaproteobacteria bacterium]|nr:hypothetical protein [Deltaproteobacteria bacterium]
MGLGIRADHHFTDWMSLGAGAGTAFYKHALYTSLKGHAFYKKSTSPYGTFSVGYLSGKEGRKGFTGDVGTTFYDKVNTWYFNPGVGLQFWSNNGLSWFLEFTYLIRADGKSIPWGGIGFQLHNGTKEYKINKKS